MHAPQRSNTAQARTRAATERPSLLTRFAAAYRHAAETKARGTPHKAAPARPPLSQIVRVAAFVASLALLLSTPLGDTLRDTLARIDLSPATESPTP